MTDTTTMNDVPVGCGCAACKAAHMTHQHIGEPGQDSSSFSSNGPDKLLSGNVWSNNKNGITLKYNFWNSLPSYYSASDDEANGFTSFTSLMKTASVKVFNMIETFTNITFQETTVESQTHIGMAQASLPSGVGAWAYYPHVHPLGGDVWTNKTSVTNSNVTEGKYGFYALMHEVGHALGLQHTFTGNLTGAQNTEQYSVMAYDTGPWGSKYAESFQLYDIWALQKLYGANMSYNTGDNIYQLQSGKAYTIWDAGGTDTLDGSHLSQDLEIGMKEGTFSSIGLTDNIAVAYDVVIENANGGSGDDIIETNEVSNIVNGNDGDDFVYGSEGDDTIDGGEGNDTISYLYDIQQFLISVIDYITVAVQHALTGLDTILNTENYEFNGQAYSKSELLNYDIGSQAVSLVTMGAKWGKKTYTYDSYFARQEDLTGNHFNYTKANYNIFDVNRVDDRTMLVDVASTKAPKYVTFNTSQTGNDITLATLFGNVTATFNGNDGDDSFTVTNIKANDKAYGGGGNDTIHAAAGNDYLYGGSGNDLLDGGDHNDKLYGEEDDDKLNGGNGNDYLYGGAGNDSLNAGAGNDRSYGHEGDDTIDGGEGNDYLYGDVGNDTLSGGIGTDRVYGHEGNDILNGGEGNDYLYGHEGDDTINGNEGNDRLYGHDGNDVLNGGEGNDYLYGYDGNDTMSGGNGNDRLYGYDGDDISDGGEGNDYLYGHDGDDILTGGGGNDRLYGHDGNDILNGGAGIDYLYGYDGNDTINGGDDDDRLYGYDNDDHLIGGAGNDRLYGHNDNDRLEGSAGNDYLYGSNGDDILIGGLGDDKLYGSNHNDTLIGGEGYDYLYAGRGTDTFILTGLDNEVDYIRDFKISGSEVDTLNISNILFNYDSVNDDINDFVQIVTTSSSKATLRINQDGTGDDWQDAATMAGNFTKASVDELLADGRLVADQPI